MKSWKLTLENSCQDFPRVNLQKLFNTQTKEIKEIETKKDGRTKYSKNNVFLFHETYFHAWHIDPNSAIV